MSSNEAIRLYDPSAEPEVPDTAEAEASVAAETTKAKRFRITRRIGETAAAAYRILFPAVPRYLKHVLTPELRREILEEYEQARIREHFEYPFPDLDSRGELMNGILERRFGHLPESDQRSLRIYFLEAINAIPKAS